MAGRTALAQTMGPSRFVSICSRIWPRSLATSSPGRLTAALFTDLTEPQSAEASRIIAALLAVLGVYFVVTALIEAAATELQQFSRSTTTRNELLTLMLDPRVPRSLVQIRIVNAARFLIGLGLFFRSEGIARLWNDFRAAGRRPAVASQLED